jgi:cytidylate kinase
MILPKIIAIAGTNGSGKDTVGELLHAEKQYDFVSLSDILRGELDKQNLPHSRENLSMMSKRIRDVNGDGGLAQLAIDQYSTTSSAPGLCLTSIRTPGEVDVIHQAGGVVVWIDADVHVRYERIIKTQRGRPEDRVTFEEFLEHQAAEMSPTKQGNGLNMGAVKECADVFLTNEFTSLDDYKDHIKKYFEI